MRDSDVASRQNAMGNQRCQGGAAAAFDENQQLTEQPGERCGAGTKASKQANKLSMPPSRALEQEEPSRGR